MVLASRPARAILQASGQTGQTQSPVPAADKRMRVRGQDAALHNTSPVSPIGNFFYIESNSGAHDRKDPLPCELHAAIGMAFWW